MDTSPAAALTFRIAAPADAPLLTALGRRTWTETFGPANAPEDLAAYLDAAFTADVQQAELVDPLLTYLLAQDSTGTAVGYALLRRGRSSPSITDPTAIEIQRFYVLGTHHGSGVAPALMTACLRLATALGAASVFLGVWQENPRAIRFYQKHGFTTVGTQTFTVGRDVQQDFVMARPVVVTA